ncbi:lipopolysaccharide-induced tumor necrosis factor-alpha factor homolog [Thunnus maccoyii]|uniref:lipopolysaccharide-induced tumor necrosis factor-alpha factor homolog n=1 Tax=Thunnus maccoyii TaxID=8240 RepID=UPI001C4D3A9D|nr:lipopolysaccharide-induced tumor necrosis factor-alpha factor homolog [Thunnus maccoyii]
MHIYYTPFNPPPSSQDSMSQVPPVYTSGGGAVGSGLDSEDGKRKFVSYDTVLGNCPGMTTCFSCQQQVMTNITYKAGTYAWLMCTLFIILGLTMCLVPFCLFIVWKQTKDVYHTCPLCNRVLHVERKKCCK